MTLTQRARQLFKSLRLAARPVQTSKKSLDTIRYLKSEVARLDSELARLRTESPLIAEYQALRVLGRPVIFVDDDGLRFQCDHLHYYLEYCANATVVNDPLLIQYIKKVVQPGDTVLDVGAHIGGISILAGKLVGSQGHVIAFEPESRNYELLKRNISLNDQSNWVTSENRAVYSSEGHLELQVFDREASSWNTLGWFTSGGMVPTSTQMVPCITLDAYCQEHEIERIALLKIDAEGADPDVLKGCDGLLKHKAIDRIVFEISMVPLEGLDHNADDIIQPLIQHGYTLYKTTENGNLAPATVQEIREASYGNYVALAIPVEGEQE